MDSGQQVALVSGVGKGYCLMWGKSSMNFSFLPPFFLPLYCLHSCWHSLLLLLWWTLSLLVLVWPDWEFLPDQSQEPSPVWVEVLPSVQERTSPDAAAQQHEDRPELPFTICLDTTISAVLPFHSPGPPTKLADFFLLPETGFPLLSDSLSCMKCLLTIPSHEASMETGTVPPFYWHWHSSVSGLQLF